MNSESKAVPSSSIYYDHAGRPLSVLVLDEEIPYPLNSGKRIRTWNLLRHLSRKNAITFLCHGSADDPRLLVLKSLGIRVVLVQGLSPSNSWKFYAGAAANVFSSFPYSVSRHHTRRFARAARELVAFEKFDIVHCEWTPYASYLHATGNLRSLIVAHNIETTIWRRRAQHASSFPERLYMGMQAWKMARFEKRSFRKASRVVTVSEEEQRMAKQWGAHANWVVSNGVDTEYFAPDVEAPDPDSLLFLGSLDWQPNRDALQYLLREIWPAIQAIRPTATLRVVGRQPASKMREQTQAMPGVKWIGEVPDVRPYLAGAAIVLVPLRIGGGSRIKILESMSMGKAVVTTSVGAEGLNVVSGVHCMVAKSSGDFSRCVAELLDAPELIAELGRNGRELVLQQYDWGKLAEHLELAWQDTAGTAL